MDYDTNRSTEFQRILFYSIRLVEKLQLLFQFLLFEMRYRSVEFAPAHLQKAEKDVKLEIFF